MRDKIRHGGEESVVVYQDEVFSFGSLLIVEGSDETEVVVGEWFRGFGNCDVHGEGVHFFLSGLDVWMGWYDDVESCAGI